MFVSAATGLPSATYPSDHLSLVAGFRFKKTDAFTSVLPFDRAAAAAGAPAEDEDEVTSEVDSRLIVTQS